MIGEENYYKYLEVLFSNICLLFWEYRFFIRNVCTNFSLFFMCMLEWCPVLKNFIWNVFRLVHSKCFLTLPADVTENNSFPTLAKWLGKKKKDMNSYTLYEWKTGLYCLFGAFLKMYILFSTNCLPCLLAGPVNSLVGGLTWCFCSCPILPHRKSQPLDYGGCSDSSQSLSYVSRMIFSH